MLCGRREEAVTTSDARGTSSMVAEYLMGKVAVHGFEPEYCWREVML